MKHENSLSPNDLSRISPARPAAVGEFTLTNPEPMPDEVSSPGELLRHAREQAGLSVADIASRLRMGIKQIEALERADYTAVPSGTFLRGFVRNYAKVVGVNADDALGILERTHTTATPLPATKVVMPTPATATIKISPPRGELATPRVRLLIAFLVLALLGGATWYWWEYVRPNRSDGGRPTIVEPNLVAGKRDATSNAPDTIPVIDNTNARVAQPALPPVSLSADVPTSAQNAASPVVPSQIPSQVPSQVPTQPTAVVTPVPNEAITLTPTTAIEDKTLAKAVKRAGDTGVIGFTFAGESWVEVIDATGDAIISKRYRAGQAEEVSGRGPFSIVVGNAEVTRMAYNGREFDLKPHTKLTVARLKLK